MQIMPRKKSNLGLRTRRSKATRRVVANQTEAERVATNEQNRRRMARTRAKESVEQHTARLEYARWRARRSRSNILKSLRSRQNKSCDRLAFRDNPTDGTTRCNNLKLGETNGETNDMCCDDGKIELPQLREPPEPLKIFLVDNELDVDNKFIADANKTSRSVKSEGEISPFDHFAEEHFEERNIHKMPESYEEITVIKTEVSEEPYDSEVIGNELMLDTKANTTSQHSLQIENETTVKLEKKLPTDNLDVLAAEKKTSKAIMAEGDISLAKNFPEESLENGIHKFSNLQEELTVMKTEVKEEPCDSIVIENESQLLDMKMNIISEHCSLSENDKSHSDVAGKGSFEQHMETHTKEKVFQCDTCEFATNNKYILKHHKLKKHSDQAKAYNCADCKFSTDKRWDFKRHMGSHAKEKRFKCNVCGYATSWKNNLTDHINLKHTATERKYKCNTCEYASSSKYTLKAHTLLKHFV